MGFDEGHYLLGNAGLALLRAGADRRPAGVDERVAEIRAIAAAIDQPPYWSRRDLPERDVGSGYAGWASSYDDPGNDTIELEEPAVRALLEDLPPGPVLDAACGTGRLTAHLVAAGREVIGVDASAQMLERARAKLPAADLRAGELAALPLEDSSVSAAVCALALSHLPELGPAVSELGRVLRPGGRLVVSNPHPFATGVLGWRAVFRDSGGARSMIPEYPHLHSDYVSAFADAGLTVRRCVEPVLDRDRARAHAKAGQVAAAEQALVGVPGVLVWEAERMRTGGSTTRS